MILWTRITPGSESPDEITVTWEVAEWSNDESMSNVVASGTTTTDSSQNYTVKVDADGLAANQLYNYRTNEWRFVSSVATDNFILSGTQSAVIPTGTKRIQIQ